MSSIRIPEDGPKAETPAWLEFKRRAFLSLSIRNNNSTTRT